LGPDEGYVVEPATGLVFASRSLTAHDMLSLAWLIENRASMPAAQREGVIDDPNTSALFINVANRIVTRWLGGLGEALRAEWLRRYDLDNIWDDRVLRRAFELHGGVPRVELAEANHSVPVALADKLRADLSLPT
jgi:hypothetical protein